MKKNMKGQLIEIKKIFRLQHSTKGGKVCWKFHPGAEKQMSSLTTSCLMRRRIQVRMASILIEIQPALAPQKGA